MEDLENLQELNQLLAFKGYIEDELEELSSFTFGSQVKSLRDLNKFKLRNADEFNEVKELLTKISTRRLDNTNLSIAKFKVEKKEADELAEIAEFKRLKEKFEPKAPVGSIVNRNILRFQ